MKNIHAYSWLAHARKYLESIAREKKHASARKKFSSRASGNWDHHSNLVDHIDRSDHVTCIGTLPRLMLPRSMGSAWCYSTSVITLPRHHRHDSCYVCLASIDHWRSLVVLPPSEPVACCQSSNTNAWHLLAALFALRCTFWQYAWLLTPYHC